MIYSNDIIKNIIAANTIKGIGPKSLLKLLRVYSSNCHDGSFVSKYFSISQLDWQTAIENSQNILSNCDKLSIIPIVYSTDAYPCLLSELDDAPAIIYVKGKTEILHHNSIAVIGSREPCEYSKKVAYKFGRYFADKQAVIVSGLALGCDTQGHLGALSKKGQTVAVLAHGLDMVYPANNKKLADEIVASDGALISEYPPGVKPFRSSFVQRDRLQSGLSKATLVVQTKIDGGSMHTSSFCLKQNRILAACDPGKYNHKDIFSGNFELINSKKAIPLKDINDLEILWDNLEKIKISKNINVQVEQSTPRISVLQTTLPPQRREQYSLFGVR